VVILVVGLEVRGDQLLVTLVAMEGFLPRGYDGSTCLLMIKSKRTEVVLIRVLTDVVM
jgi:hypothetical protein